jgi:hypothetical protein
MNYRNPIPLTESLVRDTSKMIESDLVSAFLYLSPGTQLIDVTRICVTILDPGRRNQNEGPDINNAVIAVDGMIVMGSIECHLRSGDWWLHKHHENKDYSKTILHVVRNFNSKHRSLPCPTVLLVYNPNHHKRRCKLIHFDTANNVEQQIRKFALIRWNKRLHFYSQLNGEEKNIEIIRQCFSILGKSGNEMEFAYLLTLIDLEKFMSYDEEKAYQSVSDLINNPERQWKSTGVRPNQHPSNRIQLIVKLISWVLLSGKNEIYDQIDLPSEFMRYLSNCSGQGIRIELLGNIFLPYWASLLNHQEKFHAHDRLKGYWFKMKLPGSYGRLTRKFGKILLVHQLRTYHIIQGLLELENRFCQPNHCTICPLKDNNYGRIN